VTVPKLPQTIEDRAYWIDLGSHSQKEVQLRHRRSCLTPADMPINSFAMVFRATTFLCCWLATSVPVLSLAQVIEHAHEHLEALLDGHGHSHEDGDTPHHEHEEDGSPIPADKSADMIRVTPPTLAKIQLQPIQPIPFGSSVTQTASTQQACLGFQNFKEHIPPPRVPFPGDTLPLLI